MRLTEVTLCCNEHDICYDTCNSDKEKCDFALRRCLYRICDSHAPKVGAMVTNGESSDLFTSYSITFILFKCYSSLLFFFLQDAKLWPRPYLRVL